MNAHCTGCHRRTDHRRTQFGSYYRFFCRTCGTELTDSMAHLEEMRKPLPDQAIRDAEAAAALRLPGPVRVGTWGGDK